MNSLLIGAIVAFSFAVAFGIAASVMHFAYSKKIPMNSDHYKDQYSPGMKPCDITDPFDAKMNKRLLLEVLSTAGLFLSITLCLVGIICVYYNFHDKKPLTLPAGTQ